MSPVVSLTDLRALTALHPQTRVSTLLHRIEQDRRRRETELQLRLSILAAEVAAIVEREVMDYLAREEIATQFGDCF